MADAPQSPIVKKRRRWGCLRILLYFFAFCLIALIVAYISWTTWNGYQVNQLVKDIRAKGEPITLEELEASIKVPDGEQDTTVIWQRGFEPLLSEKYKASAEGLPFVSKMEEEDLPKLGLPWEELALAEAFIAKHQASLDAFHEAAQKGGYAAFKPDDSKSKLEAYDSWRGMRLAAQLLRVELEVHSHRGEVRKAANALGALLKTSHAIANQPAIDIQLTACACDGIAVQALAQSIFRLEFSPEELAEFQRVLRSKKPIDGMKTGLIGDRAVNFAMLSDYEVIEPKPAFMPFNSDRLHLLTFMSRHITAMELGYPKCFDESTRIEQELIQFSVSAQYAPIFWNYSHRLVRLAGVAHSPAAYRIINLSMADLGISVESYRRKYGTLPRSLSDLTPEFVEKLPTDPHGNAEYVLRKTAEGLRIYSTGWREIDNGGNFFKGHGQTWDYGLDFPVANSLEPVEKKPQESSIEQLLRNRE